MCRSYWLVGCRLGRKNWENPSSQELSRMRSLCVLFRRSTATQLRPSPDSMTDTSPLHQWHLGAKFRAEVVLEQRPMQTAGLRWYRRRSSLATRWTKCLDRPGQFLAMILSASYRGFSLGLPEMVQIITGSWNPRVVLYGSQRCPVRHLRHPYLLLLELLLITCVEVLAGWRSVLLTPASFRLPYHRYPSQWLMALEFNTPSLLEICLLRSPVHRSINMLELTASSLLLKPLSTHRLFLGGGATILTNRRKRCLA